MKKYRDAKHPDIDTTHRDTSGSNAMHRDTSRQPSEREETVDHQDSEEQTPADLKQKNRNLERDIYFKDQLITYHEKAAERMRHEQVELGRQIGVYQDTLRHHGLPEPEAVQQLMQAPTADDDTEADKTTEEERSPTMD